MENTTVERITPEIAKEYLTHNTKNRKVKKNSVESLARDIKNGKYVMTHQGIAFDNDGILIDGQHRLLAVILANKPIDIKVTRGLPAEAALVVDRGVTRTMGDVMGFSNYGTTDEEIRALHNTSMLSAINQMVACGYKKMKISSADVMNLFTAFKEPILNAYKCVVTKSQGRVTSPVISAAIASMFCGVSPDAIERFFGVFRRDDISGCEDYNVQAALNWKRQINDAKIRRVSMDRKKLYLGTQNAIWHFANNSDVNRVVIPSSPRYNVETTIQQVLNA